MFLERIAVHRDRFAAAKNVLELGGGQCWGACVIKRLWPGAQVCSSDISEHAVASSFKWEHQLQVKLDRTFHCRSYELPLESESVDLVFAFQSAHHFRAHRRTLAEVFRVLRPGGSCLYLHEPTCRAFLHGLAHWRVNRKRPHVPEDVLVFSRLMALGRAAGFESSWVHDLTLTKRAPFELLYYLALSKLPLLRDVLPATKDLVFAKPR